MKRTNFTCQVEGCDSPAKAAQMCLSHYRRFRRHGSPNGGRAAKGARLAWLRAQVGHQGGDCLVPPFPVAGGYWQFQDGGKFQLAHRWMCEQANGAPLPGQQAAHSCGNGALGCVNPRHLRWATARENNADKIVHGTALRGQDKANAKLTNAEAARIRNLIGTATHREIAEQFGVSRSTVTLIATGKAWVHVQEAK